MNIPRKMEVGFFRHPSKTPNWVTIYVQISMSGQKLQIGSTGVKIPRADWDERKKEVAATNPTSMPYNSTLLRIKARLLNIFNELSDKDEPFGAVHVKSVYVQKYSQQSTVSITLLSRFTEMRSEKEKVAKEADNSGKSRPKGTKKGTLKTFKTVNTNLRKYLEHKKLKLSQHEFDEDYYFDFQEWMQNKGFAPNTIRAHCIKLKSLSKWMKRKKYIVKDRLEGLPLPKEEETVPNPITQQQFQTLYKHQFKSVHKQKAADLFVLHCRTGFHYADLQNLIKQAKAGNWKPYTDQNGIEWIFWNRNKTEEIAKIPILPEVKDIVNRYGGWKKLPLLSNAKLNQWLKIIAAEVGLPEDLTVSSGRDTMTDWLYNYQLATNETVMVILGRKDSRDLERYGKSDERRVIKELKLK